MAGYDIAIGFHDIDLGHPDITLDDQGVAMASHAHTPNCKTANDIEIALS